jgi:hypothetical protein
MSNIFQIKNEYLAISEQLQENGGELTAELETLLKINESQLVEKSTGYVQVIKHLESELTVIDLEIKRLTALKKARTTTIERMENTIKEAMELYEKESIETPLYKIGLRKSVKTVVDIDELPDSCIKIERKNISLTEIKKRIESGEIITGAKLVECKNLNIK